MNVTEPQSNMQRYIGYIGSIDLWAEPLSVIVTLKLWRNHSFWLWRFLRLRFVINAKHRSFELARKYDELVKLSIFLKNL